MKKIVLLIALSIGFFSGCTHPETMYYNGYIIVSGGSNKGEGAYIVMWDVTKEEVETVHEEILLANNDHFILVRYDQDDPNQNKFKVGDKVIVSTKNQLDETREVRATKIDLDTTSE